jgi:hypothetical protein
VGDGQPDYFTNWGGGKRCLWQSMFFGAFFYPEKYDFILYEGFFMKNMSQIRLLIATHLDQSNYLPNQKRKYSQLKHDLTLFIRPFQASES